MKNAREIYFQLSGDVYAKYTVSAETLPEGETPKGEVVVLDLPDEEMAKLFDEGAISYPLRSGPVYEPDTLRPNRKPRPPFYYTNGALTPDGVIGVAHTVAVALNDMASDVWENIDPRCSAKVPSRLYRNVAYICADVLNHLGIGAKVSKLSLEPELHNGLKNQYRVVVCARVPRYPWRKQRVPDPNKPGHLKTVTHREYEDVEFDFDVTNSLRISWVWPNSAHVMGMDARILREGRPVCWTGSMRRLSEPGVVKMEIMSGPDKLSQQSDVELLLSQTSFADVLLSLTDGTPEGNSAAIKQALGIEPTPETIARFNRVVKTPTSV